MKDILDKLDKIVLTEGQLGDLASKCEADHEVQMARADLFKIAKYAIKLHDMMKNISEAEGIEGWKQSKITKAADYIGSVYHSLDYEMSPMADEAPAEAEQMGQMAFNLATEDKTDEGIKIVPKPGFGAAGDMDNMVKQVQVVKKPVKSVKTLGGQTSGGKEYDPGKERDTTTGNTDDGIGARTAAANKKAMDDAGKLVNKSKTESDLGRETRKFSDWGKK